MSRKAEAEITRTNFTVKGVFAHPWDLTARGGAERVLAWVQAAGLRRLYLSFNYHSGWFIHPGHPHHRAFMTEGSVAYYRPDERYYRATRLRPISSAGTSEVDDLRGRAELLERYGVRLIAWVIGAHNTRLGLSHPECAQRNAYGDRLPHALSVGHEETREYLKAMCRELSANFPLDGVLLESFGWMSHRHGHHHERDLVGLTPLEEELFSLCFNPETMRKAETAGVDAAAARQAVRETLDSAFREAPERRGGHPRTRAELEAKWPEVAAYRQFCENLAAQLIHEIKGEALAKTDCRLHLVTGYDEQLAGVADGCGVSVYGLGPAEVRKVVAAERRRIPTGWKGELACFVRLGMNVPRSAAQLREIMVAAREGGASGPVFYNLSESPPKMLGWIEAALNGL